MSTPGGGSPSPEPPAADAERAAFAERLEANGLHIDAIAALEHPWRRSPAPRGAFVLAIRKQPLQ
jgi:hypothetical protein